MPQLLPQQVEDLRFGMNSLDSPKKLNAGVWQLIENMLPGISGKPRNALNEKMAKTDTTGYSSSHSFFRPNWQHISAGGKDFFIGWTRTDNASYKDEYQLEVWNLTDNTRTKLEYGEFNADLVFFGFNKLYNALYCVFDYEIKTNHTSAYRTKNKILEYVSGAWAVREMGIDCAPEINFYNVEEVAGLNTEVYSSAAVEYNGNLWIICGAVAGTGARRKVINSSDGVIWKEVGTDSFPANNMGHRVVVYDGKMWSLGGTGAKRKAYYSTNGSTWTEAGIDAIPTNVEYHTSLIYDGKMWVIGGENGGGTISRKVYYSTNGSTWTEAGTDALPVATWFHSSVVFAGKMWVIGGSSGAVASRKAYYSTNGSTWTEAGTDALPKGVVFHQTYAVGSKMFVVGGEYTAEGFASRKIYSTIDGATWTQEGSNSFPVGLVKHSACVFNGETFIIGGLATGSVSNPSVYQSVDGVVWNEKTQTSKAVLNSAAIETANEIIIIGGSFDANTVMTTKALKTTNSGFEYFNAASFPKQISRSSIVVYNGVLYLIGGAIGYETTPLGSRKVYSSTTGLTWTEVGTDSLPVKISGHTAVVYDNKIWLICGFIEGGTYSRKVYYSTDCLTWTEAGTDAFPVGLAYHTSLVFANKMWVIGGYAGGSTYARKVFNSTNGSTWTEAGTDALPVGSWFHSSVVFNGRMWVIGGTGTGGSSKKCYYSKDGTNWIEPVVDALPVATTSHVSFVIGDKIFIYGGSPGTAIYYSTGGAFVAITQGLTKNKYYSYAFTFARIPADVGHFSTIYSEPVSESIVDITRRIGLQMTCSGSYGTTLVQLPEVAAAIASGATHIRVWRTLGADSQAIADGLTHRFVLAAPITSLLDSVYNYLRDSISDNYLTGETNFLETTGYDVPPQGRFVIWAGGRQWIGGNPDNKGYWFYSELPANTRYPQKYASMFRLDQYFNTCDPSDGQYDTGVCELSGDLYFFKERKIFALAGANPDNVPTLISDGIGCAFPHTLVVADVSILGGRCAMFISESGPASLTAGGQVRLLNEFKIAELWPSGTGNIIKLSTGVPTDWYTRNKVTGCYWNNTYWIFFGDSRDTECNLATNKIFGFHFGIDGVSVGPLQVTLPQQVYNSVAYTICEPQMLIPVDNNRAYTLSHKTDRSAAKVYRLLQFLDPAKWQDTYLTEGAIGYSMVARTRYLYAGSNHTDFATPKAAVVHMTFADSSGLTITVTCDATRLISANTYAQTRQSGMGADNLLRHFLWDVLPADGAGRGSFFDVKVSKVVPSTGAVEFFGTQIEVDDIVVEREYSSPSSSYTGSTTYVKQADAVGGEENAY